MRKFRFEGHIYGKWSEDFDEIIEIEDYEDEDEARWRLIQLVKNRAYLDTTDIILKSKEIFDEESE